MPVDKISELRRDYSGRSLRMEDTDPDPFEQFRRWFSEAEDAGVDEANAMSLATVGIDGRPSVRIVLLKGVENSEFIFFTNYTSRKARELDGTGVASLCFWWSPLARQVRVEGRLSRSSREASAHYFHARPRESQIGAWASKQSSAIVDRGVLEERVTALESRFANQRIPLPPFWGGYGLSPDAIEFWQGRPSRLHDRILYQKDGASWTRIRLAP